MARQEPQWREKAQHPAYLHSRWTQKIDIPVYLRRWLNVHGNKRVEQNIPEILEAAMLLYYRALHGERFRPDWVTHLVCGRYVEGNERDILAALEAHTPAHTLMGPYQILNAAAYVCVSNGVYGYFFCIDPLTHWREGDTDGLFVRWVREEWTVTLRKQDMVWPVIHLPRGEWPLRPELIPGHPWSQLKLRV